MFGKYEMVMIDLSLIGGIRQQLEKYDFIILWLQLGKKYM